MLTTQQQFDQTYWASQPAEVQALPGIADPDQRATQAAELATNGFTIDVPIMVWGWDPWTAMSMRADDGYTWVPSALQPPIECPPGIVVPGLTPYDPLHPPAGSIRVSTNIADYPPALTAAPAPPASTFDPVGLQSVGAIYLSALGDTFTNGAQFTDSRGTFVKQVVLTPFGRNVYWEKIA